MNKELFLQCYTNWLTDVWQPDLKIGLSDSAPSAYLTYLEKESSGVEKELLKDIKRLETTIYRSMPQYKQLTIDLIQSTYMRLNSEDGVTKEVVSSLHYKCGTLMDILNYTSFDKDITIINVLSSTLSKWIDALTIKAAKKKESAVTKMVKEFGIDTVNENELMTRHIAKTKKTLIAVNKILAKGSTVYNQVQKIIDNS